MLRIQNGGNNGDNKNDEGIKDINENVNSNGDKYKDDGNEDDERNYISDNDDNSHNHSDSVDNITTVYNDGGGKMYKLEYSALKEQNDRF